MDKLTVSALGNDQRHTTIWKVFMLLKLQNSENNSGVLAWSWSNSSNFQYPGWLVWRFFQGRTCHEDWQQNYAAERNSLNMGWGVMQRGNDKLSDVWQEAPEALPVWGCGHGCTKPAWLKLCGCLAETKRAKDNQTLLVNPEVISICTGDVKRLSRK